MSAFVRLTTISHTRAYAPFSVRIAGERHKATGRIDPIDVDNMGKPQSL